MSKCLKIISLVLILVFIITACKPSQDETILIPTETPEEIYTGPVRDGELVTIRLSYPTPVMGLDFPDYYANFKELIKDRFKIDLNISFQSMYSHFYDQAPVNDIFEVALPNMHAERKFMWELDYLLPFSDFIDDSKAWDNLPESFKNAHMDSGGNVWALPVNDKPHIWARTIRKDWIKNTKTDIPGTVDELYNLMQIFTYNDPDLNGQNDTYGSGMSGEKIMLMNFKDIFEANGCFFSYNSNWYDRGGWQVNSMMMGYNPKTGLFEDCLDNPGFLRSLETIQAMRDNKFIDLNPDMLVDGEMSNPKIGMNMSIVKDLLIYPTKYEYCYSLEGTETEKTASVLYGDGGIFYLSKQAKEPQEVVPAFIEMMYGSVESYKLMRYGPLGDGKLYSEKDGKIYKNDVIESITSHLELIGDISWLKNQINTEIQLPEGVEKLNEDALMQDNNMLPLSHIHMALLEYSFEMVPYLGNPGKQLLEHGYIRQVEEVIETFYRGEINANEFYEEIEKIHKKFQVENWITESNQRWLGMK